MKNPRNLIKKWPLLVLLPLVFLTGCRWGCLIHEHRVWPISPVENETISGQVEIIWGYYYRWGCYFGECPSPETYATYDEKWHNLATGEWGIIATGKPINQSSMWDTTQVPEGRYEIWIYTYNYHEECNPWDIWDQENYFTVRVQNKCTLTVTLDPEEVRPTGAGTPNITTVIVKVTDVRGDPVPNAEVTLEAEAVQNSGGHQHNSDRPPVDNTVFNPPTGTTDANGEFRSRYTASAFGGKEIIIAKSEECPGEEGRATLTVKVPGLVELYSGASYYYELKEPTSSHPSPYWVADDVRLVIALIADLYHYNLPNNPNLVITDASLEWGGGFDIGGHWEDCITPRRLGGDGHGHQTHREGRDIDVRIWNIPNDHRDEIEGFASDMGAVADVHQPPHYHLDF